MLNEQFSMNPLPKKRRPLSGPPFRVQPRHMSGLMNSVNFNAEIETDVQLSQDEMKGWVTQMAI